MTAIREAPVVLELMQRIGKDTKAAAANLGRREARYMVDAYYMIQENRKRSSNQVRALDKTEEPNAVVDWFASQFLSLEKSIARALDAYSAASDLGMWARSIKGIGPIIAAGLLAHIDLTLTPTAGCIWRFAGLDPTLKWVGAKEAAGIVSDVMGSDKKVSQEHVIECARRINRKPEALTKARDAVLDKSKWTREVLKAAVSMRPWNAALKTLCWKIGESFVKVSGNEKSFYGQLYLKRRIDEGVKNEAGDYADQAAAIMRDHPTHAQGKTYKQGKLPDGHLHARAKRYAVKMFLAHYHEKGRKLAGLPVPNPYPIEHLGHADKIEIPES